jgi:hypothetical protein
VGASNAERTCYSVTWLESMYSEGARQFAYLLSQLTIGVGRDMPGIIALRYCDPVISAPEQVLCIV